jgi:hypothetical protein
MTTSLLHFTTFGTRLVFPHAKSMGASTDRVIIVRLAFRISLMPPPSMRVKAKARLDEHMGQDTKPWRVHDLRRTAASGMAALGFQPHIIGRVLNHLSGAQGGLVGIYQRYEYLDERKRALHAWGSHVEALVTERPLRHLREPVIPLLFCGTSGLGATLRRYVCTFRNKIRVSLVECRQQCAHLALCGGGESPVWYPC